MTEREMIEEMASIICKETSNKGLCEKCGFKKHEQFGYTYQCRKFDTAEALYNAEYRKITEDEVVLSQSEIEDFSKDQAEVKFLKRQIIDQTRKETAMEIFAEIDKMLKRNHICSVLGEIDELRKRYGVEVW